MHSVRKYDDDDPHFLDPIIRIVEFEDEPAVAGMASLLRTAWRRLPPEGEINLQALGNVLREVSRRESRDLTVDERDPDTRTIDSPWRLEIKHMWRHVFYDAARWLNDASGTVGSLEDDSWQWLAVPAAVTGAAAIKDKLFENNRLIVPAFLAPNVKIRVTRTRKPIDGDESIEKDLITFGAKENASLLYLRHGFHYNFYVESGAGPETNGDSADTSARGSAAESRQVSSDEPAAVFAMATMLVDEYASYRIQELQQRGDKELSKGATSALHGQASLDRADE